MDGRGLKSNPALEWVIEKEKQGAYEDKGGGPRSFDIDIVKALLKQGAIPYEMLLSVARFHGDQKSELIDIVSDHCVLTGTDLVSAASAPQIQRRTR